MLQLWSFELQHRCKLPPSRVALRARSRSSRLRAWPHRWQRNASTSRSAIF